ncbi:MAG: TonB-dependent receptor plug domain-containing protein [Gemmatimonadales bacterium]
MRRSRFGASVRAAAVGGLLVFGAGTVWAQNATITGKVTDEQGRPLGGASVVVQGTPNGAATNVQGSYTITLSPDRATGQQVTIVARYLGKSPGSRTITLTAGSHTVDFELKDDPLRLDELVVTGVSEATSTKKLAFAVGRVSADQLQETPGVTALGALAGKVSGVRLVQASGEPGTTPTIRLRGSTSISGSQDPLIILDGTITRLTMADIAAEDIERVEVIKGAAASSLYGSDAANGVIQIFTKRGANLADGKLLVTSRNEGGVSFLSNRIPTANAHAFFRWSPAAPPRAASASADQLRQSHQRAGRRRRQPIPDLLRSTARTLGHGVFLANYVSVGQRRGQTNFNASFQNTRTEGVVFGS